MSINSFFWILLTYVFAYYFLTRSVPIELKKIDRNYFGDEYRLDAKVGMEASMDMIRILFDFSLPEADYTNYVRYGLFISRALLVGFLPVAITLCFFVKL